MRFMVHLFDYVTCKCKAKLRNLRNLFLKKYFTVVLGHIDTAKKCSGESYKTSLHNQGQKAINKSHKKLTENEILLFSVKTDFQKETS